MEVHHHRKKESTPHTWRSYLTEFLMLFLAVFLGSIAEYQLEHKVEHNRERAFIKSMKEDLQEDQQSFKWILNEIPNFNKRLDTISKLLVDYPKGNTTQMLLKNYEMVGQYRTISMHTKTASQLNNGGYRLIRIDSCRNQIGDYYTDAIEIENVIRSIRETTLNKKSLSGKLFYFNYFPSDTVYNRQNLLASFKLKEKEIFYNKDKQIMYELANIYQTQIGLENYLYGLVKHQEKSRNNLLHLLNRHYK